MSSPSDFDIGPLTWVKGEIDAAIDRSQEFLTRAEQGPEHSEPLRFAQSHIHQIHGALSVVGLDGVSQYTDAIDKLITSIVSEGRAPNAQQIDLLKRSLYCLQNYLNDLATGVPNQPLRLYALYAELNHSRGADAPSPSELFFPNTSIRPALSEAQETDPTQVAHELRTLRAHFEKGLLAWIRSPNSSAGPTEMLAAVKRIERLHALPATRAFWWAAIAFFEGLEQKAIAPDRETHRVCRRIDTQMRRLLEGSQVVADRLVRDVLYFVATAPIRSTHTEEVRSLYQLEQILPPEGARPLETSSKPLARALKEILEQAKDAWNRFCAGAAVGLPQFQESLAQLSERAQPLKGEALNRLFEQLSALVQWLRSDPLRQSEALAMEVATALLLIENALNKSGHEDEIFEQQVSQLSANFEARQQGENPASLDATLFGEASQQAQEKLLLNQLAREILTNLGQVEQTLDQFFRNPNRRDPLKELAMPLKQIEGAFSMLGEYKAVELLRTNSERIAQFAHETEPPAPEACEEIAHELSALGFFVEALRNGPVNLERFVNPNAPQTEEIPTPAAETVETHLARQSREIKSLVKALQDDPDSTELRAELQHNLEAMQEDAHLAADRRLEDQAREALHGLRSGEATILNLQEVLADSTPPTPEPSEETVRLLDASTEEIDAELLEIFIEEAREVIASMQEHLGLARSEPHNQEYLITIRRNFHTMKGSSRMVGLQELSDAAKSVEMMLNRWLQLEKDAEPALLELVQYGQEIFGVWVEQLASNGPIGYDASTLVSRAEHMLAELDTKFPDTLEEKIASPSAPTIAPPIETTSEEASEISETDIADKIVVETSLTETHAELNPFEIGALQEDHAIEASLEETRFDMPSLAALGLIDSVETEQDMQEPQIDVPLPDIEELESPLDIPELEIPDLGLSDEAQTPSANPAIIEEQEPPAPTAQPSMAETQPPLDEEDLGIEMAENGEPSLLALEDSQLNPIHLHQESSEYPLTDEVSAANETFAANDFVPQEIAPENIFGTSDEISDDAPAELQLEDTHLEPVRSEPAAEEYSLAEEALSDSIHPQDGFGLLDINDSLPATDAQETVYSEIESTPESADMPTSRTDAEAEYIVPPIEETFESDLIEEIAEPETETQPLSSTPLVEDERADESITADTEEDRALISIDEDEDTNEPLPVMSLETPAYEPPVFADAPIAENEPIEADTVQIGEVSISRPLYELYLGEARQHINTLQRIFGHMENNPMLVADDEVVRTAHTLAGISGTARIQPIRSPAKALESALERLQNANQPANPEQVALLRSAADTLDASLREVAELRMPLEVPELVDQLDHLKPSQGDEAAAETQPSLAEFIDTAALAQQATHAPSQPEPSPILHDEIDEQLLPIFFEEADELITDIGTQLRALRQDTNDKSAVQSLARQLHTLKGSARMTGAMSLGEHIHGIESHLEQALNAQTFDPGTVDELEHGLDQFGVMLNRLREGPQETVAQEQETEPAAPRGLPVGWQTEESVVEEGDTGAARASLRIRAEMIDRFVNEAGEISIARTRIEGEMRTLRRSLLDLTENVIRLRNQLREVEIQAESQMQSRIAAAEALDAEFDPLEFDRFTRLQELTRMMAESVGDVTTIQQNLLRNLDSAETSLHAQGRLSRDLQQELMNVRMVPFNDIADRLYRVVRQTAKELGKRANLDIRGGHVEIDRSVLDKMVAPIEHLLRNAVAHGLEMPDQRAVSGKPEIGQITLTLTQQSNEVLLELLDDGQGLNYEKILARGRNLGLIGENDTPDENRLTRLIFEPGFSTASEVSEIAGRGVGMDVVKNETVAVGGRIDIASTPGQGARFLIHLPLTLAVTQALMVRAAGRSYAIPSSMVQQALEIKTAEFEIMRNAGYAEWKDTTFPFYYLPHLLGDSHSQPEMHRYNWVLLLRTGSQAIAVHVDDLRSNQEIVVKNAGPQFSRLLGYSGATIMPDGEIALILNPVALAANRPAPRTQDALQTETPREVQPAAQVVQQPTVMVVDDSLTVRKITSRLLEREGYRVITAKDGVDALEQLVETLPDVMLLDIEMPRMDGFDLTRNIRADQRMRHLPIIMITSRMADKHRNYAFEIGVNHYLGKPYQEEELLGLIQGFVNQEAASS